MTLAGMDTKKWELKSKKEKRCQTAFLRNKYILLRDQQKLKTKGICHMNYFQFSLIIICNPEHRLNVFAIALSEARNLEN